MEGKRNPTVECVRALLRSYWQKLRLLLIRGLPVSAEDEDDDLPLRFRVFLLWSSRFASEKIKIDITGDLFEVYKFVCAESGRAEANRWLIEQLNSSLRDFIKHYLSNSFKKLLSRAHAISSVVFLVCITTIVMQHGQGEIAVRRANPDRPPNYEAQTTITPEQTLALQAAEGAKNISRKSKRILNSSTLQKKKPPTPNIISLVTLTPYGATRSASESDNITVRLTVKTTRIRFRLMLPEESHRGLYRVNLEDPFGNDLWTTSARSMNGRALTILVDTRLLTDGYYQLSVLAEGGSDEYEAPVYYLFTVNK